MRRPARAVAEAAMGIGNVDCRCCGGRMNQADVRQLALYYHNEDPSMVAVQYVCPRCGTTSWRHFDPVDLRLTCPVGPADWTALAAELGLTRVDSPAPARPLASLDLSRPIACDETIEFARRMATLNKEDLEALANSLL